jgi:hypothetical protein
MALSAGKTSSRRQRIVSSSRNEQQHLPSEAMRNVGAETMRDPLIAAACAAGLRGLTTASSMTGPVGFGCFALTIRCGIGGECLRFRDRLGRWA